MVIPVYGKIDVSNHREKIDFLTWVREETCRDEVNRNTFKIKFLLRKVDTTLSLVSLFPGSWSYV